MAAKERCDVLEEEALVIALVLAGEVVRAFYGPLEAALLQVAPY